LKYLTNKKFKAMKKIIFAILTGAFLYGNAQITLTSADAPQVGDVYYNMNDTGITQTITPGPSGENVVWDFSMLANDYTDTTSFVDASTIPQSVDFPQANLVQLTAVDTTFINSSSSNLTFLGFLSGGFEIKLDDPLIGLEFPYTYGTTYTDTGHLTVVIPYDTTVSGIHIDSVKIDKTIISTDSCIAYGQLLLPNETFNNVLMNKNSSLNIDSIQAHTDLMGWVDVNDTQYTTISYAVYTNGYGQPLLNLSVDDNGNVTDATYKYSEATFASTTQDIKVSIYPNPAEKNLTVTIPDSKAEISIINISGQKVLTKQTTSTKVNLNIASLPSGTYVLKVKTNKGIIEKKFVKE
jgi:hypothetical protein